MEFHPHQAIYLQIVDYICEKILRQEWVDQDRIPAVREIAMSIEVNPNTVMRAYVYLEEKHIIYTKRGIGYFVSKEAYQKTLKLKKAAFLKYQAPAFFKQIKLLGIRFDELKALFLQQYENEK